MSKSKHSKSRPGSTGGPPQGGSVGIFLAIAILAAVAGAFLYQRSRPVAPPVNQGVAQADSTTSSARAPSAPLVAPAAPLVQSPVVHPAVPPEELQPALDMNSVPDLLNYGNELLSEGKLEEAERLYRRAIEVNPEDEDTHFNLGILLIRSGRTDEAVASYERALTIYPDYVEAQNNLANALLTLGRTNDAIARLEEAVALNPDYAPVLNNLGRVRATQLEWEPAFELLERACELDPENFDYQYNLGTARMRKGDFSHAVKSLALANELRPGDPRTISLYSAALAYDKRPDQAVEVLNTGVKQHPENVELLYNLGQLHLHNGRPA